MTNLNDHFSALLGLDSSWLVEEFVLKLQANQVLIRLAHRAGEPSCSCCDETSSPTDVASEPGSDAASPWLNKIQPAKKAR